jgi:peptide/nickel transport system substrate-binding protein
MNSVGRNRSGLSRRQFLRLSGLTTAAAVVAACTTVAPPDVPAPQVAAPAVPGQKYNEAPELAARVAAGELPPVDERLPTNPRVIQPEERVGTYGGTWRTGLVGGGDSGWLIRTLGYENLIRWDPQWEVIMPNVAESFSFNDESTEFTFHLREGMRWSDGEPFTADDILYYWEAEILNDELTPSKPTWLVVNGELGTLEKVDDYTVRFRFSAPHGLFIQNMAGGNGLRFTLTPKHYIQQFHKEYNPDGIDALVAQSNQDSWVSLYQAQNNEWNNSAKPTLHGWILETAYGEATTRVIARRNPYYFKVDTAGNQLPYLDSINYDLFEAVEVLTLRTLNGDIDMQSRHVATLANKSLFTDNMAAGDYRFFDVVPAVMNTAMISLNQTHKDPVKREIFQNKDFRIGLSHAINRQELIDLVYVGQGEPWQASPRPESSYHHQRLAKQYTEYDPDLANEYLDNAYPTKDADGFRLGPDGNRITFTVMVSAAGDAAGEHAAVLELVTHYWQAVGLNAQFQVVDRSLFTTRMEGNEHDGLVWRGHGGWGDAMQEPSYYFPFNLWSAFAPAWTAWFGGLPTTEPEEPPAPTQQQMELYRELQITASPERQIEIFSQILDIAADEFYVIGVSLEAPGYGVVKNNFHNVPAQMPGAGWAYIDPAASEPSQFFIEQ